MKNLTKFALTGALIFGLNGCIQKYEQPLVVVREKVYDSLKTKYDSLIVEKDFWIKKATECEMERSQELLSKLKELQLTYNKNKKEDNLGKEYWEKEKEEIKKGVMEEFNK